MTKERRKKVLSPKEIAALREEKEKAQELSPAARQRRFIINFGVGILLLAFATSSGITCVNWNSTSASARKAAQQAGNQEKVDPAAAELERWQKEAVEKPNDPSVLANLAYFYLEQGDHNSSTKKEQAKKDYDEAGKSLEAALKISPDYAFALRLMAKLKARQEKWGEAKTELELALKASQKPIDPKDPEKEAKETNAKGDQVQAFLGLAELALRSKDYKGAIAQLDQAIKLDPGSMEAYGERAEAFIEDKQPEAARKDLQTVMQIAQAMPGSRASMMAAQRAQMILYQMDMPAPSISATPGAALKMPTPAVTPAAATPAPVATPSAVTPAPVATETPVGIPTP